MMPPTAGAASRVAESEARDVEVLEPDGGPAAADLSRGDLASEAQAPSLDPEQRAHDDEPLREDLPEKD